MIGAPTDGVAARVEQLRVGDTVAASAPVFALVERYADKILPSATAVKTPARAS
jgi:multidrug resistance efflux pump